MSNVGNGRRHNHHHDQHGNHHNHHHKQTDDHHQQGHCGAQGAILVEIYRETGDMLGLGLNRWKLIIILGNME